MSYLKPLPLLLLGFLCACQSAPHKNGTPDAAPRTSLKQTLDRHTRDNAASLLYDLLNNEKNVSKILVLKSAAPETAQIIKAIADASADALKTLDSMAAADHRLNLHQISLPPGELAARDASSRTAQRVLLHTSDEEFEFQLILTQVQALGYGSQLAKVAAASDPNPAHAQQFTALSNQLNNLYQLATDRLRILD